MRNTKRFTDQLRAAVLNAEDTRYKISKATGIPEGNLSRFVNGGGGLSMESIDLICEHLGLRLVGPKRTRKTKSKGR
jgi:Cro/C1-type HTH DNA-binding domain